MATILTVKNRSSKKPIKRLPSTIEIDEKTTVEDVKKRLAKHAGGMDPNRLGIFYPDRKRTLKDRKASVAQYKEVIAAKELLVQDLGPQISWRTMYIIEYAGPILMHILFPLLLRPYLYSNVTSLSQSQVLAMILIELHYFKREYETMFLHKFSAATMPARLIPKNCGHYWGLSGVVLAYFIYSPTSYAALESPRMNLLNIIGIALYLFGEISNHITHITLSNLRSPGGTERGIPKGYGFNLSTCPNYFFEIIAWVGLLLITKDLSTIVFIIVGTVQMYFWAAKKERQYRTEFGNKYRKHKYLVIPSPGILIRAITG